MKTFVAFDIESTGFEPVKNRMVELSAVKFTLDGEVLGEFDELMDPGIPIPEGASKVNKIYDEDVRGKPDSGLILEKFSEFLDEDSILIAHNSEFDCLFIGSEYQLNKMPLPGNEIWDSLTLSRRFVKNIMNHKMETLVHHFGFRADGFHRALVDSYHVMNLFLRLLSDGHSVQDLEEHASKRTFDKSKELFAVQLPLNLMSLKKSISKAAPLQFEYEEEPGEKVQLEVTAHCLFRGEKHQFLSATRKDGDFPESFRLDRLSKPKLLPSISS